MSEYLKDFKLKSPINQITYFEGEPLKLTNELQFFHNKSRFRKELTRLQYLFQKYLKTPLMAAGIRDSYIKEEYTEKYLIILFTTQEIVKEATKIVESRANKGEIQVGCFYLENNSKFMLLIAKDMKGLILGIDAMEDVLEQNLKHYLKREKLDDYIKIRPFSITNYKKFS